MKRDRFLTGILVGIFILVVLAVSLFFLRRGSAGYVDEGTPGGVVHNYLLAVQRQEYERAYIYLADLPGKPKPTLVQFEQVFLGGQQQAVEKTAIEIGETTVDDFDQLATVQVVLIQNNSGLLGQTNRNVHAVSLVKQSGKWKIVSGPYPFWVVSHLL